MTGLDGRLRCLIGGVPCWLAVAGAGLGRPRWDAGRYPALVVVFVVLVWCVVWAAPAAARPSHRSAGGAPASRVVLRSSLHRIRTGVSGVWASGDYLLSTIPSTTSYYSRDKAAMLINDRLGTTTTLDARCAVDALGPPWVVLSCPLTSDPNGAYDLELYSIADRTRQTLTPNPGVPPQSPVPEECGTAGDSPAGVRGLSSLPSFACAAPVAVGAYWIRWDASCYHCADTYLFQNIQTGELRKDPANATTFADLNSPALAHKTCSGVRLMREEVGYGMPWGSLTPYGQFALAIGTGSQGYPAAFLERCGTRMRRLLDSANLALASNPRAIVWQTVPGWLRGLFLPSLQAFTIRLPSGFGGWLGLTSGALYVTGGRDSTLWRTASPTALPLNTSRPTLTRSGRTLTCRRGSWRNAVGFAYAWRVNGSPRKGATKPRLIVGKAAKRRRVSCSVTASNTAGTTTASSVQLHLR